jgi:hypothetical protein
VTMCSTPDPLAARSRRPTSRTMSGLPSLATMVGLSSCVTSISVHDPGSGARYGTTGSGHSCSPALGTTRDGVRSTFSCDGGPRSRASPESRHHPTCTPSPNKGSGGSSLAPAVEPPYLALPSVPTSLIDPSKTAAGIVSIGPCSPCHPTFCRMGLDHPDDHPDDPSGSAESRLGRRGIQHEQARSDWSRPDRRRASVS